MFPFPERVIHVRTARTSLAFLKKRSITFYALLVFGSVSPFFPPLCLIFFVCLFVCFLFILARRTQTVRRSWITYSFGSPKMIEFLSPFPFRKRTRDGKNYASPRRCNSIFCLFILFPIYLRNKIPSSD